MTMTRNRRLEQQIREIIEVLYNHLFINRLEVLCGDNEDYILKMYIHDNQWCPLVIAKDGCTEQEFLDYIVEELRTRNLIRSEHYKIRLYENYRSKEGI